MNVRKKFFERKFQLLKSLFFFFFEDFIQFCHRIFYKIRIIAKLLYSKKTLRSNPLKTIFRFTDKVSSFRK